MKGKERKGGKVGSGGGGGGGGGAAGYWCEWRIPVGGRRRSNKEGKFGGKTEP